MIKLIYMNLAQINIEFMDQYNIFYTKYKILFLNISLKIMEGYVNKKITYISYFYNELYLKDFKYFIENINENINENMNFIIYTSYDII